MNLLLCVVSVLVALTVGESNDNVRSPRSPQSSQRFGALGPLGSNVAEILSGVNGGLSIGLSGFGFGGPGGFGGVNPGFGGAPSSGCRYWCRTPEGAAYCCENANQPTNPFAVGIVKPGQCPPVRPVCPRVFGPPATCSNDGACGGADKCCFDRCLGEHVCKPPLGLGR